MFIHARCIIHHLFIMQTYQKPFSSLMLFVVGFLCAVSIAHPQNERNGTKLVVVITIDNFRNDYISKFEKSFSDSGFLWLKRTGTYFPNAFYDDAVTVTGKGHATITTGCYGGKSGIISNSWYSRDKLKSVNCVEDSTVAFVQSTGIAQEGQRSPINLRVMTIGDELKNKSPNSKVFGVSIKDRGAILPAGRNADGAYWFDDRNGVFATSTYYRKNYPQWLQEFNKENSTAQYFNTQWTKLFPEEKYAGCDTDNAAYEEDPYHLTKAFPHPINGGVDAPDKMYYRALMHTPNGTDVLIDFAQQLIIGEQLGSRDVTDMLCLSISTMDFIAHAYGPNSHEIFDATARLDRSLASFFRFLETTIGLSKCLLVVTADHGSAAMPEFLAKSGADAGRISPKSFIADIEENLNTKFGKLANDKSWIEADHFPFLYIRRSGLTEKKITLEDFEATFRPTVLRAKGIAALFSRQEIESSKNNTPYFSAVKKSYHSNRAGDYFIIVKPNYIYADSGEGTSHGSPHDYDAHVPLFIRSHVIPRGVVPARVGIADVAPTLAKSLQIPMSGETDGKILPVKISQSRKTK